MLILVLPTHRITIIKSTRPVRTARLHKTPVEHSAPYSIMFRHIFTVAGMLRIPLSKSQKRLLIKMLCSILER